MSSHSFNLKQQAYDRLREWLQSGRLVPGTRVSTLHLSKQLGISRTPVREALSRLASDGIVKEVPGFGAYVHLPSEKELRELYGVREVLEVYAARLAVEQITEQELEQLHELCLQWLAITRNLRDSGEPYLNAKLQDRWIRIDQKFHSIVLTAAGNAVLFKTIDDMRLMNRTLDSRRLQNGNFITVSSAARSYRDHARLYQALRKRDGNMAEAWVRRSIALGRERHLIELRSGSYQ